MEELKPCLCGAMPIQETKIFMLGTISDGGYPVPHGRFVCPVCGYTFDWGKSYSVKCGWDKNIQVWNKLQSERRIRLMDSGEFMVGGQ